MGDFLFLNLPPLHYLLTYIFILLFGYGKFLVKKKKKKEKKNVLDSYIVKLLHLYYCLMLRNIIDFLVICSKIVIV